jgi:hypothetical protein
VGFVGFGLDVTVEGVMKVLLILKTATGSGYDPCTNGIQVNVSYQLKQVGIFLTQYRLIAVLK